MDMSATRRSYISKRQRKRRRCCCSCVSIGGGVIQPPRPFGMTAARHVLVLLLVVVVHHRPAWSFVEQLHTISPRQRRRTSLFQSAASSPSSSASPSGESSSLADQASLLLTTTSSGNGPVASSSTAAAFSAFQDRLRKTTTNTTVSTTISSSRDAIDSLTRGLSKYHLGILSRTSERQSFVTGRYPLTVSFVQNPTRQWLRRVTSTTSSGSSKSNSKSSKRNTNGVLSSMQILINGTSLDRSVASLDRFHWLEENEEQRKELLHRYSMVSLEFVAEVQLDRPGYVQILSASHAGSTGSFLQRLQNDHHPYDRHDPTRMIGSSTSSSNNNNVNAFIKWQLLKDGSTLRNKMNRLVLELAQKQQRADRLWATGFALGRRSGLVQSVEVDTGSIMRLNDRSSSSLLWPNEVTPVPAKLYHHQDSMGRTAEQHPQARAGFHHEDDQGHEAYQDALLVSDGFLVPGKDRGGLYIVKHPGNPQTEWTVRLTSNTGTEKDRWFYHRATWVDLTGCGDGRQSILTARCKVSTISTSTTTQPPVTTPSSTSSMNNKHNGKSGVSSTDDFVTRTTSTTVSGIRKQGQLVWLECPLPSSIDPATGTPLEKDGTVFDPFSARHLPWKEHVLAEGPDVMFCVAQLDDDDDSDDYSTIQVLSSQFFGKRVVLHSIQIPKNHAHSNASTRLKKPRVVFERIIDDQCGAAFGCILANLDGNNNNKNINRFVLDSGSTVPTLEKGDAFSHLLVTSHERSYSESNNDDSVLSVLDDVSSSTQSPSSTTTNGGSLFAYRIPEGKGAWKTQPWTRSTVATGFKVKGGLGNMINPGAPGFVYTFHAKKQDKYSNDKSKRPMITVAGDCAESAYLFRPSGVQEETSVSNGDLKNSNEDPSTRYKLMVEIQCGATVGSIGVGYDDFISAANQGSGYAKLYIPCFEKDKILVFALGSGDDDVYDEYDSDHDDELEENG